MNAIYTATLNGFRKWLQTLGFAESTGYTSCSFVKDFFKWLEKQHITELKNISKPTINNYHEYLQNRANKRLGGGLSQNTITGNINALKRLSKYLQETGKVFFEIDLQLQTAKEQSLNVLSKQKIQKLYNACRIGDTELAEVLGIRDKAFLDIYYGCGLRRSEGVKLNIDDVLLKEKLVHVSSGKGYKERYVPITETLKESLGNYINTTRKTFLVSNNSNDNGLFIGITGKRIGGMTAITRIKQLANIANLNKPIGLHTLRHSIATHLLQSGMNLEDVSQFLGHCSLESTQIYTHIANEI